jgi:peptidoglycan-associated lipoprotein
MYLHYDGELDAGIGPQTRIPDEKIGDFSVNHAKSTVLMATLAVLLAACSSTPVAPDAPAAMNATAAPAPTAQSPAAAATARSMLPSANVNMASLPAYLDPKSSIFAERSVYFDFDDFSIKPEYSAMVERHGKFLASNPRVAIKIEGNTDERGGSEYNLALGQKRAEVVLRALRIYGAKDSQMEAISWGQSKPKAMGHDEAAWAQNRRDDFQYPMK